MTPIEILKRNVDAVRARILVACERVGRDPAEIRMLTVTKYAPMAALRGLLEIGVRDFGENRPQQLAQRAAKLGSDLGGDAGDKPCWRMIGHLQRNKVRQTLEVCREIHSLDSIRLADEIESRAKALNIPSGGVGVFVEINTGGEDAKTGLSAEAAREVVQHLPNCPTIHMLGLMTMAPYADDPQTVRPMFAKLRALRDEWIETGVARPDARRLSMGMSNDFEVAIEEGATDIRLGSVLFEGIDTEDPR
ncbi:MAG: YggS family pyridoxal phosphate-dependent enzyme [Phycisphaerales bacterium]|nr:YggS family pyridoxal phosphate-dependent enzyme [Phycisphaerales bacterium]